MFKNKIEMKKFSKERTTTSRARRNVALEGRSSYDQVIKYLVIQPWSKVQILSSQSVAFRLLGVPIPRAFGEVVSHREGATVGGKEFGD